MDKIEVFKALSNETRLNIVEWLKEPEKNFPPQGGHFEEAVDLKGGVCVGSRVSFWQNDTANGPTTEGTSRPLMNCLRTLVGTFELGGQSPA